MNEAKEFNCCDIKTSEKTTAGVPIYKRHCECGTTGCMKPNYTPMPVKIYENEIPPDEEAKFYKEFMKTKLL